MQWALLTLSGYVVSVPSAFYLRRSRLSIPFAMSPLSRSVFADSNRHLSAVALAEERLPMRWVPSEPLGLAVAPPISPYAGPVQSPPFCRTPMGAQGGVSYFSCATFRKYSWRSFCQFHWLMRVPAFTFPSGCVNWTLEVTSDWVDLVSPSSPFQDSVDCADF